MSVTLNPVTGVLEFVQPRHGHARRVPYGAGNAGEPTRAVG